MTYSIEISEQAERDLRNIFEYIANTLQAPQSAVSQLERLEKHIYPLGQMPNRHHLCNKEP